MKRAFILLIIILNVTGCSYIELNKLAVASSIGIDFIDNKYVISASVMDIEKSSNSLKEKSLLYEAEGETISKAIRNMSESYPNTLYLGHLEIVVLGKTIDENKISDIFDYIMRSPEIRSSGYVLINDSGTAKEVLKPDNEDGFITESIKSSLKVAEKKSGTVNVITFEEFLIEYLRKGIDPTLPVINVTNDSFSKTVISGMTPVSKNKSPKLSKNESIAYNTIFENYEDIVITPKYENEYFGAILFNPKSKIKVKIDDDVKINIDVSVETKLNEVYQKVSINDKKTHKEFEKIIANELKSYIEELLNYCKKYNTDLLGFKNEIYKNYYKDYDKYKDINLYEKDINVNIKTKIYRSGKTNKGAS